MPTVLQKPAWSREYMTSEVRWRTAKRVVMMVGDEVNDAAHGSWYVCGLLGEGRTLAMYAAIVSLMDSDLNRLILYIVCNH